MARPACLRTAVLVAAVLAAAPSRAEEPDFAGMLLNNQSLLASPPKNCDAKTADLNTFEMQQCAAVALREADRVMTQAYQQALKTGDQARNDRLTRAQRAWLTFRNLDCDWASLHYEGGSLAPVVMGTCLVEVTRARTTQLQQGQEP